MRSMVSFRILWCNQGPIRKRPSPRHAAGMTSHGLRRILATELGWPRCCWFSSPADTIVSFARGRKSHKRNCQESRGESRRRLWTCHRRCKDKGHRANEAGRREHSRLVWPSRRRGRGHYLRGTKDARFPSMTRYGTTSKISRTRLLPSPWVSAGLSEGRTAASKLAF